MANALDQISEMKAAAQANVDALAQLEDAVKAMQNPQAPSVDSDAMSKLQDQIDAKVKECDALRAAIQAHLDDDKADQAKLEAAIAPIEAAPAPVVPDVPAATTADTASAATPDASASAVDPAAQATPVSLDSAT